jgi:molybdopterin-guanine dinucleotide biosynthesis protein MobB
VHGRSQSPQHPSPPGSRPFFGPVIVAVRGPSRSGKTAMCERLIRNLNTLNLRIAWLKRTHHAVDLPGKASGRIWAAGPAASLLSSGDRQLLTLPPGEREPAELLPHLPPDIDVVLLETHEPAGYPTILSNCLTADGPDPVLARWDLFEEDRAIPGAISAIQALLPADRALDMAMRAALRLHGGHGCAGLVLGTRLALAGAARTRRRSPRHEEAAHCPERDRPLCGRRHPGGDGLPPRQAHAARARLRQARGHLHR